MVVKAKKEYRMSKFAHTVIPVKAEHTEKGIVGALLRVCGTKPQGLQIGLGKIVSKKLPFHKKGPGKNGGPPVHSVHLVFVDDTDSIPQAVMEACSILKLDTEKIGIILEDRHVGNGRMIGIAHALSELTGAHVCVW